VRGHARINDDEDAGRRARPRYARACLPARSSTYLPARHLHPLIGNSSIRARAFCYFRAVRIIVEGRERRVTLPASGSPGERNNGRALQCFSCRLIRGQCAIAPRQLATTLLLACARTHRGARAIAIARANTLTYAPYRRSRVPAALCACRAWDRHCLLLFVLSFPGHGRSRRLDLANRNRFILFSRPLRDA